VEHLEHKSGFTKTTGCFKESVVSYHEIHHNLLWNWSYLIFMTDYGVFGKTIGGIEKSFRIFTPIIKSIIYETETLKDIYNIN
jgi:hypothetical protein